MAFLFKIFDNIICSYVIGHVRSYVCMTSLFLLAYPFLKFSTARSIACWTLRQMSDMCRFVRNAFFFLLNLLYLTPTNTRHAWCRVYTSIGVLSVPTSKFGGTSCGVQSVAIVTRSQVYIGSD